MNIPNFWAVLAAGLVAGCSAPQALRAPPLTLKSDHVEVAQVLKSARCEIERYLAPVLSDKAEDAPAPRLVTFSQAGMVLKLKTIETKGATGGVVLALPIGPSRLSLNGSDRPSAKNTNLVTFEVTHIIGDPLDCSGGTLPDGDLGITSWLLAMNDLALSSGKVPKQIRQTVTFEFTRNRDLTPRLERSSSDVTRSGSSKLTDNLSTTHEIAVVITPDKPDSTPATDPELSRAIDFQRLELLLE